MIPFRSYSESISNEDRLTNWFGIYIHIPFCVHKCSYCDFYSFTRYHAESFERLVNSIQTEIVNCARFLRKAERVPGPVSSIFLGGGTPSLLPAIQLKRIFQTLSDQFDLKTDAEITMEANPETINEALCEGVKTQTPINRISMGAQSFSPELLKKLERLCSPAAIYRGVELLKVFGFDNFSLDLIFGIPGQGLAGMLSDISRAAALEPKHISSYNLTLKPGHKLFPELISDDEAADLFEAGVEAMARGGYEQYEISNFSKPGSESQHNLLYWSGGDYLGVGPSAASRFFWDGRFFHRKQLADFERYAFLVEKEPEFESTTASQTLIEATFLELRKNCGVDLDHFRKRYGCDLAQGEKFDLYLKNDLIRKEGSILKLSPRGRLLADAVTRDLADTNLC